MADHKGFYAELGVDRGASDADIKKAYHTAALRFHPDKNQSEGAEEKFKAVANAAQVLTDPEKRAQYDEGPGHRSPFGGGGSYATCAVMVGYRREGSAPPDVDEPTPAAAPPPTGDITEDLLRTSLSRGSSVSSQLSRGSSAPEPEPEGEPAPAAAAERDGAAAPPLGGPARAGSGEALRRTATADLGELSALTRSSSMTRAVVAQDAQRLVQVRAAPDRHFASQLDRLMPGSDHFILGSCLPKVAVGHCPASRPSSSSSPSSTSTSRCSSGGSRPSAAAAGPFI